MIAETSAVLIEQKVKFSKPIGKIERVQIGYLTPSPWQPRQQMDQTELMRLRDSIKNYGFIGAIEARRDPANPEGALQITFGHRRWQAAAMANERTIPVSIVDRSDEEMALIAYLENQTQVKLTPWEEALSFRGMKETMHLAIRDIALYTGKSRGYVANRLDLLRLPEDSPVRIAAAAGEIDLSTANAFLNLHHVLNPAELKTIANGIVSGTLVAKDLKSLKLALSHKVEAPVTEDGRRIHEISLARDSTTATKFEAQEAQLEYIDPPKPSPERVIARIGNIHHDPVVERSDRGFAELARQAEAQRITTEPVHQPILEEEPARGPIRVVHSTFRKPTSVDHAQDVIRILEEFSFHLERTVAKADLGSLNDAEWLRVTRALDRINQMVQA